MPIKSFRGLVADGGMDKIPLSTRKGSQGYRITKLQVMTNAPFTESEEHVLKIYKIPQDTVTATVDFSDPTLIATAIINSHSSGYSDPSIPVIVFDGEIFNQDIFITHQDVQSTKSLNYYLELEQIKLNETENTVATLKDIRAVAANG